MELDVIDLSVSVSGKTILHDVSFKVLHSECMGVVGPNGSGKTILLQSLIGLREITGSVFFGGRDMNDLDFCREGIYYVPDHGSAFDMTARRNLEFFYGCYNRNKDPIKMDRDVDDILGAARLMARAESQAESLSPGMRRRLAYATTMVSPPTVLLMDDPFSNLDTDGRIYLEGYLRSLKRMGTTMVVSSNDLLNLQGVCDSVILLRGGCIKGCLRMDQGIDLRERYLSALKGDVQ